MFKLPLLGAFKKTLMKQKEDIKAAIQGKDFGVLFLYLMVFVFFIVGVYWTGLALYYASHPKEPPPDPALFTNAQICTQTKTLTDRMINFEKEWSMLGIQLMQKQQEAFNNAKTEEERKQLWNQQGLEYMQLHQQEVYDFRTTLLPEALSLRNQFLQRIPTSSAPTSTGGALQIPVNELHAFQGVLAGPRPVEDTAVYLEELAIILCPDK